VPAGLIVRDQSGQIVVDTSTFLGRSLGQITIGFGTGTVTNEQFTKGIGWCTPLLQGVRSINANDTTAGHIDINLYLTAPRVYFSGNQMIWSRSSNGYPSYYAAPTCILYYGIR
jgi:hypothetical protein